MIKYTVCCSLALGIAITAAAYNPDQIVQQVVDGNPSLKVLKAQSTASSFQNKADNALAGPEAEFEHLWGERGSTKWSVGVTQSFDWPGVYRARSKAADAANRVAVMAYLDKRMQVTVQARQSLVQLQYAKLRLNIVDSLILTTTQLNEQLATGLNHGMITILDYKKSKLELTKLRIERAKIIESQNAARAELETLGGNSLVFDDSDYTPVSWLGTLQPLENYTKNAMSFDPSLALAAANVNAAKANATVASRSTAPGFSIGYRHAMEEEIHYNGLSIGIQMPTWGINRTKSASTKEVLATETEYDQVLADMATRISGEHRTAVTLRDQITELRSAQVDGNYLSLLKEMYDGGEINVLTYLTEQSYYLESTLAILDLEEQYALALTSLNRYDKAD